MPDECWQGQSQIILMWAVTVEQSPCLKKICITQFSCSVMSSSFRPHGLWHARPPCLSPTPGVYSNSYPLSRHLCKYESCKHTPTRWAGVTQWSPHKCPVMLDLLVENQQTLETAVWKWHPLLSHRYSDMHQKAIFFFFFFFLSKSLVLF